MFQEAAAPGVNVTLRGGCRLCLHVTALKSSVAGEEVYQCRGMRQTVLPVQGQCKPAEDQ